MTSQISSNGTQQNSNFTSLAPSSAHLDRNAISFLNKVKLYSILEALDDPKAFLASVDRLTSSIFSKFSRILKQVSSFGALVLEHTQVVYGAAPVSFLYSEFQVHNACVLYRKGLNLVEIPLSR